MKKKASRFVTDITRIIFKPYGRIRYGFKYKMFRDIEPPCIVLCNHVMTLDPLFVGCCLPFPINYVASDSLMRHKGLSKLLNFLIQPIFKTKSMADTRTVMDIMSVIKQGGSVCIFPEGNRTINGVTANIPDAIKKLIKRLRVPVVILQTQGSYFCDPRWAFKVRRGRGPRPTMELKRVITPEEQDRYDTQELFDIIKENMYYNAFDDRAQVPVKYKGHKRAENIERALFVCPDCKAMAMYSEGNVFGCRACGMKAEYNEYAGFDFLSGQGLKNIYEWDKWQISHIAGIDFKSIGGGEIITSDGNITLFDITKQKRRDIIGKNGTLSLTKTELVYGYIKKGKKCSLTFNLNDIDVATIQGKTKLEIRAADGRAYLFKPPRSVPSYKYMILIYRLKAHNNNKEFDFYGI